MKRTVHKRIIAAVICGFTQIVSPAKQSVKAYKTGLKNQTWTVAILNPNDPKKPLSVQSFKEKTSILPGKGLHFNFDVSNENIIKVYPTIAKDAKTCIQSQNNNFCGKVKERVVTKENTPAGTQIKIQVSGENNYEIVMDFSKVKQQKKVEPALQTINAPKGKQKSSPYAPSEGGTVHVL